MLSFVLIKIYMISCTIFSHVKIRLDRSGSVILMCDICASRLQNLRGTMGEQSKKSYFHNKMVGGPILTMK